MANWDGAYGMLGIAVRAGQVVSGETAVEKAIRSKSARLVMICDSASQNTRKAILDASAHHGIPCHIMEGERLGRSIGKPARKVAAVTGELAEQIKRHL